MSVTAARAYAGDTDLHALIEFLTAARTRNPVQRWHTGDLVWRMFLSSSFVAAQNVRLWQDESGAVGGFGWMYPPNAADLHTADPTRLPEMVTWAQESMGEGEETLYVVTLDTNQDDIRTLDRLGFAAEPAYGVHLRQTLADAIAPSVLPAGFTIRPLAGAHEVEARARLHQQAFDSQMVTVEGYRNVTRAPVYDRALDLVVVAPDGRLAAFCLCWLDEINKVGLVEPVGTHPDFRRMGLARAVTLEGLRRMQARGMQSAVVASAADNEASLALYAGLGFRELESRERVYARPRGAGKE